MKKVLLSMIIGAQVAFASSIKPVDAYIKAVPNVAKHTAAYLQIENNGQKDRELIDVKGEIADAIEIHTHKMVDGMMKMGRVESIKVPAGKSASLKPMHDHIMLINLKRVPKVGEKIDMTLVFKNGENLKVTFPVIKK